jgi:26S proteasome regulatory subunit (ATPase 3-interacting protein)
VEVAKLRADASQFLTQAAAYKEETAELSGRRIVLEQYLPTPQLIEETARLRDELIARRAELAALDAKGLLVTAEDVAAIDKAFIAARGAWKQRKEALTDVLDKMAESSDKPPAELIETMGVETDEDANVSLKEVTRLYPPLARTQKAGKRRRAG